MFRVTRIMYSKELRTNVGILLRACVESRNIRFKFMIYEEYVVER